MRERKEWSLQSVSWTVYIWTSHITRWLFLRRKIFRLQWYLEYTRQSNLSCQQERDWQKRVYSWRNEISGECNGVVEYVSNRCLIIFDLIRSYKISCTELLSLVSDIIGSYSKILERFLLSEIHYCDSSVK